eukprot:TRINITY_DN4793_c0_g1_i2.p1 TRINITY_DN4793_c0_g1~~TRINITY_DN4793_c0_g1_i2.p1  ORF type:complete len:503 (+),score=61.86 TRINITY_DN4793_c0_g1_i2:278-1786(+)
MCFELTEEEELLFSLLAHAHQCGGITCTIRVAGGWVRDKLLSKESDDIDLVVDHTFSAASYAQRLQQVLELYPAPAHLRSRLCSLPAHAEKSEHDVARLFSISKINVMEARPEQGKHVETATFRLLGYSLDVCSLRSDKDCEDAALQDALCRDFTINAMFYNVNTKAVEDFSGHGREHLQDGIIATPIDPLETLFHDPLRSVRALRFASRFAFSLNDTLARAISDCRVHEFLGTMVSRERIWQEISKVLKGWDPSRAFRLMAQFGLAPVIFFPRDAFERNGELWTDTVTRDAADCSTLVTLALKYCGKNPLDMRAFHNACDDTTARSGICASEEDDMSHLSLASMFDRMLPFAAFLLPAWLPFSDSNEAREYAKGQYIGPFTKDHATRQWNIPSKESSLALDMISDACTLLALSNKFASTGASEEFRVDCGIALRDIGERWRHSVVLGAVGVYVCEWHGLEQGSPVRSRVAEHFGALTEYFTQEGLVGKVPAWEEEHLVKVQ